MYRSRRGFTRFKQRSAYQKQLRAQQITLPLSIFRRPWSTFVFSFHTHSEKAKAKADAAAIAQQQGEATAPGASGKGRTADENANASPLDPIGAVYEPPSNSRGAAPYRRVVNRQVRGPHRQQRLYST